MRASVISRASTSRGSLDLPARLNSGALFVDAHLGQARLRSVEEMSRQLNVICPSMSVPRAARAGGILFRLGLNIAMALRTWWRTRRGKITFSSRSARAVHLLAIAEAAQLTFSLGSACVRLLPLVFSFRRLAGIGPDRLKTATSSAWRRAAEASNEIRRLASCSDLAHIPRMKHVVPGVWTLYGSEMSALSLASQDLLMLGLLRARLAAAARLLAFAVTDLLAIALGLASLNQKIVEVRAATHGWVPFFGFANQITGIVDQEELRMVAVQHTLFAGEGNTHLTAAEEQAIREFNGVLLRHLCLQHSVFVGFLLYLSLTSEDLRRVVVVKGRDSILSCGGPLVFKRQTTEVFKRTWLSGPHEAMLFGVLIRRLDTLAAQLDWRGHNMASNLGDEEDTDQDG